MKDENLSVSFPKDERLCPKPAFEYLFSHCSAIRTDVAVVYFSYDFPDKWVNVRLSVAFVVSKRLFKKAVIRNRLKRRMREAYRLNKYILQNSPALASKNLVCFIKYNSKSEYSSQEIEDALIYAFRKISKRLQRFEVPRNRPD